MRTAIVMLLALVPTLLLISCGDKEADMKAYQEQAQTLVATEHAFAKAVAEKGMRDGFIEFLDDTGILFTPLPVNGKESMLARQPIPSSLEWEPSYAEISRIGDLGFTTGPWRFYADSANRVNPVWGQYVSIWRKQGKAGWQLMLDLGIAHDPLDSLGTTLAYGPTRSGEAKVVIDFDKARGALKDVEFEMQDSANLSGYATAILAYATDDIRILRGGHYPATGAEAATPLLRELNGQVVFNNDGVEVSKSGDLGYTYGRLKYTDSEQQEHYYAYARIWRTNGLGKWQLCLDIMTPAPNQEAPQG